MKKQIRPGERASRSGRYEVVGTRGNRTGIERTVTKGEPMPPTPKSGQAYVLVDAVDTGRAKAKTTIAIKDTSHRYGKALSRLAKR